MRISMDGEERLDCSVLALGMFDGVHLGHRALLMIAKSLAKKLHIPMVACTFIRHPMALVAPEKAPPMLTTLDERAKLMEAQGVDILYTQTFDREKMNQEPERYIEELCSRFRPKYIVAGYNFSFGKGGAGTPAMLAAMGKIFRYRAEVVPKITWHQTEEISSTIIRELLGQGNVKAAKELLGYAYRREAVVSGRKGQHISLVMEPNGKQDVPAGEYRVLLEVENQCFPAILRMARPGQGKLRLPEALCPGNTVGVHFYRSRKEDRE